LATNRPCLEQRPCLLRFVFHQVDEALPHAFHPCSHPPLSPPEAVGYAESPDLAPYTIYDAEPASMADFAVAGVRIRSETLSSISRQCRTKNTSAGDWKGAVPDLVLTHLAGVSLPGSLAKGKGNRPPSPPTVSRVVHCRCVRLPTGAPSSRRMRWSPRLNEFSTIGCGLYCWILILPTLLKDSTSSTDTKRTRTSDRGMVKRAEPRTVTRGRVLVGKIASCCGFRAKRRIALR
jgi:hypothetical protein